MLVTIKQSTGEQDYSGRSIRQTKEMDLDKAELWEVLQIASMVSRKLASVDKLDHNDTTEVEFAMIGWKVYHYLKRRLVMESVEDLKLAYRMNTVQCDGFSPLATLVIAELARRVAYE